jgi:hypothetical protein
LVVDRPSAGLENGGFRMSARPQISEIDVGGRYTQMLWMGLKKKAAYLPG